MFFFGKVHCSRYGCSWALSADRGHTVCFRFCRLSRFSDQTGRSGVDGCHQHIRVARMLPSGERLDKVMTTDDPTGEQQIETGNSYSFENVSFHYAKGQEIIQGVSFDTPSGLLTALVGPSGSGKSTLLRLMARFWDYQTGHIWMDGKDIREVQTDSLLSNISMVMQNAYLFRGTIRDNLCFGNESITEEQMIKACKQARCHDFISALPEGYDTIVGEGGATLSGGERQRISLARSFLKDVPILLLDEPTASLDADNEAMVQKALDEISKERTVIMIAHRLKTVRSADQILVLQDGKIVEKGTHNQLIGQKDYMPDCGGCKAELEIIHSNNLRRKINEQNKVSESQRACNCTFTGLRRNSHRACNHYAVCCKFAACLFSRARPRRFN